MDQSESSDLGVDLRAYVNGRRESKREQVLLRRLRALPQPQLMEVLAPLLEINLSTALVLVDRAQLSRAAYLAVLQQGLIQGNASSVKFWMKATLAHLGWRRVISALREALTTNPRGGAFALYHVPYFFHDNAPSRYKHPNSTADLQMKFQNTRPSWKNHLRWPESPTLPPMKKGPTAVSARKPAATSFGKAVPVVTPYIFPIS